VLNPFRKRPELIIHGTAPLNAEPPMNHLRDTFLTPQDLLYVRSHGDIPKIDGTTHRVAIKGCVSQSLSLSLADIQGMPSRTVRAVMQCAGNRRADLRVVRPVKGDPWTGGAIGCADWTGVALGDVLAAAGAQTGGDLHVAFTSADICQPSDGGAPYGVSLPMTKALHPDTLVAYAMNGEPLAAEHGFPLRIVTPGWAGVRSPKWLSTITVQDHPSEAHQQAGDYKLFPPDMRPDTEDLSRGLTIEGMPLNSAITEPAPGARLKAGHVTVRGYAAATDRGIARIDLSDDGGRTWTQATLEEHGASHWGWTFWHGILDLPPGDHEICVRAWDTAGQTQPARPDDVWNFKGYLSTAWHRVHVTVT
jgi:sulfite oxidase